MAAIFWQAQPGFLYGGVMRSLSARYGLTTAQEARLYAMTSLAAADGAIACWNDKYYWNFWRPTDAVHEAASDGNPNRRPIRAEAALRSVDRDHARTLDAAVPRPSVRTQLRQRCDSERDACVLPHGRHPVRHRQHSLPDEPRHFTGFGTPSRGHQCACVGRTSTSAPPTSRVRYRQKVAREARPLLPASR